MPPVLFDSSIYISAMRQPDQGRLLSRRFTAREPLWLSSVVLEELYAGTKRQDRHVIETLERQFDKLGRILVPNLSDWTVAGKVLAELGAKYAYENIGRGRVTNDTLIAISAGRVGITVITMNERDFRRISEFRPIRWHTPQVTP